MDNTLQLDIPLLLPDIDDEKDACVERLLERIGNHRGIEKAHVDHRDGEAFFCLHVDPEHLSIEKVRRIAEQEGAAITDRYRQETVRITDMDCGDCAHSIEHILARMEGVLNISVNYAAERMWVEFDSEKITLDALTDKVGQLGFRVEEKAAGHSLWREHWELVLAILSGCFLAIGFFGEWLLSMSKPAAVTLYALAYLTGGYNATRHGVKAALHFRFDIDFLMVVAAIGAAVLGEWLEGALLLFLFSLGHALEHAATDKARNAIRALGDITPKSARVRRDGEEAEVAVGKLERGDIVIVRPGERIPVDGEVRDGHSSVDQSPVTGESVPVDKAEGEAVFAGTVNGDGALEVAVTKLAEDSTLARVIKMVEESQSQKSPTQQFARKFQRVFVPATLGVVLAVIVLPPLAGWLAWEVAFLRAMTILVAASPCALAIATPAAVLSGIAQAARNGVLIKGGVHLENLGMVTAMAFDKTGTLTEGRLAVTDIVPLNDGDDAALLRTAAAVESRSGHPLAKAIVAVAEERDIDYPLSDDLQSISGKGVTATVEGRPVWIGNARLFDSDGAPEISAEVLDRVWQLESNGKTTMIVASGDVPLGIIALADRPRETAQETIERLKAIGIETLVMITGDNERVAEAISREVGLTDYRAGLLPDDKVAAVEELRTEHRLVAMVGDGVNDAPAMTTATVGIAMGAGGTDVALETADVALMADDISRLPFAVALSRQSRRVIQQNLWIALGVIITLVPAAMFGLAGIGLAIVFHEGSTLVVVANALRLLRFQNAPLATLES